MTPLKRTIGTKTRWLQCSVFVLTSVILASCAQPASTTWKWHPGSKQFGEGTKWDAHLETKYETGKLSYKLELEDVGPHISTKESSKPTKGYTDFSQPPKDPVEVDEMILGSRGLKIPEIRLRFYDTQGFVVDKLDILNLKASEDVKTWLKTKDGSFTKPSIYRATDLIATHPLSKSAAYFDIDFDNSTFDAPSP